MTILTAFACHLPIILIRWKANANVTLIFMLSDTRAIFTEQMFDSQLQQFVLRSHLVWHNRFANLFSTECKNVELKQMYRGWWPLVKYFLITPISFLNVWWIRPLNHGKGISSLFFSYIVIDLFQWSMAWDNSYIHRHKKLHRKLESPTDATWT